MGHRRTPQADSDFDGIWYYVASKGGSLDIADRFVDSITGRLFLLATQPNIGRARDEHRGRRRADSSRAARQPEH
jgi:plasmid stabilization system protein ParE